MIKIFAFILFNKTVVNSVQSTNNCRLCILYIYIYHVLFSFFPPSLLFQTCVLFLYLLPFFASCAIYFYLWIPDSAPSLLAAGIKASPILSLVLLVFSYNGGRSLVGVAGGLLLSAGGDCCLIWPELFIHGKGYFFPVPYLYLRLSRLLTQSSRSHFTINLKGGKKNVFYFSCFLTILRPYITGTLLLLLKL